MRALDFLVNKRVELLEIAARHGASNIRVFGSVARGEETVESDIDLLVDMQEDRGLYELIGLQQELEEFLGRKTDVMTANNIAPRLMEKIVAEAMPL